MQQQPTEQDLKEKLIRDEILDKKYEEYEFHDFVIEKTKRESFDIASIPLSELKNLVSEFAKEKKKIQIKLISEDVSTTIANLKQANIPDKETPTVTLTCKKLEKSQLNDKDIKIVLKNPKTVETSFLASNYVNYEVETTVVGWLVRRRFSDFEWLRMILARYNPGHLIPPLPGKKVSGRRFEDSFIQKRMASLQKFMDTLSQNEYVKASEPFVAFLNMQDRNQFEAKMKELSSYQPSPYIEESKTFDGNMVISSEEDENEKYFATVNKYFQIQTNVFEKLNTNLKAFYANFNQTLASLQLVTEDLKLLHTLNSKMSMRDEIAKAYEELGSFMQNWQRIMLNQNKLVKVHIKDFFKYVKQEGLAYMELVKARDESRTKYVAEKVRLINKKEKLWQGMEVGKWEIIDEFNKVDRSMLTKDKNYAISKMCTRETTVLENMRKQLGYSNKMSVDMMKILINVHCKKYLENLNAFNEGFYPLLTEFLGVYSGLQMFVAQYSYQM